MPLDIPGYYYDAAKRKYFKIEKSHTAPPSAAWSADVVKRRKVEDHTHRAAQQRARLLRRHIRRSDLSRDVVASVEGQLLARELGLGRCAEYGRGRPDDGDVAAAAWAGGVVPRGLIPFAKRREGARLANMPCFYVAGGDEMGLGVAYATLDEERLVGSYIPTDKYDRIHFDQDATCNSRSGLNFYTELIQCPQMSSIKYHSPSHKILLTSREPDHSCGLYFFSPPLSSPEDGGGQPWQLGETDHYQRLSIRHRLRDEWLVHQSTPAPAASDLLCVIGTNAGILRVRSNEKMAWIAPGPQAKGASGGGPPVPQEIFDQDFQQDNHNVLLAGGRQPRLWVTDLRAPAAEWAYARHPSAIAHLRSVAPHQVLVAGLENSMALYDLRFFGRRPNGATPLLRFPGYRNAAHVHAGWDVSPELDAVAAAQDDGTVMLFSLRSGRMLRSPALGAVQTETPVRSMMFQRLPQEKLPSLFLGEGANLRKFSFGSLGVDDEA